MADQQLKTALKYTIYDLKETDVKERTSPIRSSAGLNTKPQDQAQDLLVKAIETTWNFYKTAFQRDSLDGNGEEIFAGVHYMKNFGGAHWDHDLRQFFVGDGGVYEGDVDGPAKDTKPFALHAIDAVAHELTHGVIGSIVPLGNPGVLLTNDEMSQVAKNELPQRIKDIVNSLPADEKAEALKMPSSQLGFMLTTANPAKCLDEHIADCFAIITRQFSLQQTAESSDWLFAPGVWTEATLNANQWTGNYLRTFKLNDTRVKQPDRTIKTWKPSMEYYAGRDPHIWAGIGNYAFYLAAKKFEGKTWENVGRIWYNALRDEKLKDKRNQNYKGWRDLTVEHARKLFNEAGATKVTDAWKEVGL